MGKDNSAASWKRSRSGAGEKPWTAGVFGADGVGLAKRIEVVGMGTDFDADADIGNVADVVAGVAIGAESSVIGAAAVPVVGKPDASTS